MGGFARRTSYWNAFAQKYPSTPTIRVDGGSIFSTASAESPLVNKWMLEGTFKSRLDALNLSASDVPVWQEMADLAAAGQVSREYLNLPLVSANLKPKAGNFPAIQRFLVREFDLGAGAPRPKLSVGITGVLFDPRERISRREFEVKEPVSAVREVLGEIRGRVDYFIVLTDMDLGRSLSMAIVVPGIDLLAVCHNYEAISEPQQVGDSLLVLPVNEARMISEVRVLFENNKASSHSRFVPLDATVPDELSMGELVKQAQAELDRFRAQR
jgi:hypothetical protein